MDIGSNLRHHEEEAQKKDIVEIVAQLTNGRPAITDVVTMFETALKSAYERGIRHAVDKMRETGKVISYE